LIYVKPTSLIWIKPDPFNPCSPYFMISFTYRCPRTGQNVHGHIADDLIGSSDAMSLWFVPPAGPLTSSMPRLGNF